MKTPMDESKFDQICKQVFDIRSQNLLTARGVVTVQKGELEFAFCAEDLANMSADEYRIILSNCIWAYYNGPAQVREQVSEVVRHRDCEHNRKYGATVVYFHSGLSVGVSLKGFDALPTHSTLQ